MIILYTKLKMKNTSLLVRSFLLFTLLSLSATFSPAQNYTSNANGSWTTGGNWSGGSSPSLTSQSWGTININHNLVISGNYNLPGGTINLASGNTLSINGNLTLGLGGGGNKINVSGILNITGNVKLYSNLNILPGGKVIVDGSVTVVNSTYLKIGTNVAPPAYADMVIKQNLISESSGDILVERNGRVAIYGDFTNNTSGGTKLTVNNGGQVYIDGDINLVGGGDAVVNNNSSSPYGLYVNGTSTTSGGGSSITGNRGDKSTMENTNPSFYSWVESQSESPLPVELLFFKGDNNAGNAVLSWATSSELNFDYFAIEKSSDGHSFLEVGRVSGQGTTSERNDYSFEDTEPSSKSYYRLKSVDFDGYTEYFNIVVLEFYRTQSVSVYPNPVTDSNLNIQFEFAPDQTVQVLITDLVGAQKVFQVFESVESQFLIPISLEPGTYILRIKSDEFSAVSRIMVK
jgi:hypothetical protein